MVKHSDIDKENNQPKKESDLVKFLKKRSFIYLACTVFFVVFFVPDMIQPDNLESKTILNLADDEQKVAWEIIKSYKGTDDEGSNLFDMLILQIENAYVSEEILKHKDTKLEISVSDIQDQKGAGFYEVHLTVKTHDNVREYIWNVNIDTEEIAFANNGAKKMLNIVDNYD